MRMACHRGPRGAGDSNIPAMDRNRGASSLPRFRENSMVSRPWSSRDALLKDGAPRAMPRAGGSVSQLLRSYRLYLAVGREGAEIVASILGEESGEEGPKGH